MSEILTTPEQPDFQASIDAITSRCMTPENLNQYGDKALDDLIGVVDEAVQAYRRQPTIDALTAKEGEQTTFTYFGMEASVVEATLDHIASVADQIRSLDNLIFEATVNSRNIIIPPNEDQLVNIFPSDGSFQEKQIIPRLKTVAFILENQFEIDLRNPEEFSVTTGVLGENMMRGQSYNLIEVPALNRAVFVCDEEGNATFVFDTVRLAEMKFDSSILSHKTKNELSELLERQSNLGRRVVYSPQFVQRMVGLLEEIPLMYKAENIDDNDSRFLKPSESVPESSLPSARIANKLGVASRTVDLAVKELQDQLSPVSRGRAKYYLLEDQQRIQSYLKAKGVFAPLATEDQQSVLGMAKKFEVPRSAIGRALKELEDEIGAVDKAKFVTTIGPAYSLVQQDLVNRWLNQNEKFGVSEVQLAKELKTTRHLIRKIRRELGEEEVVGSLIGEGRHILIPTSQHDIIGQKVAEYKTSAPKGISNAPEGYESKMDIARRLGVHSITISRAIQATRDQLSDVITALFSNNPSAAYSPEQQGIIESWLSENMKKQKNSKFGRSLLSQTIPES